MFARMRNTDFIESIKQQAREAARGGKDNWLGAINSEHERIYQAEYNRELGKIIAEENPEIVLEDIRQVGLD